MGEICELRVAVEERLGRPRPEEAKAREHSDSMALTMACLVHTEVLRRKTVGIDVSQNSIQIFYSQKW